MRNIEMRSLYDSEYTVKVLNGLLQTWDEKRAFSCFGQPKRCHMLLYLEDCAAVYTLKNGDALSAEVGSMVYIPQGAEYSVRFCKEDGAASHTAHINFLLKDGEGQPLALGDDITVLYADNVGYQALFHKIARYSEAAVRCHGKIAALMYELLFALGEYYHRGYRDRYSVIDSGIARLEGDEGESFTVAELAAVCHVSEVYFRRLFKQYAGISPAKYRMDVKINRAKGYLGREHLSIAEISDRLGFSEVSYFIKCFKESTGLTPRQYRRALYEEGKE